MNAEVERGVKEPRSIQEALNSPEKNHWKQALNEEYDSLMKNRAWDLVQLPKDRNTVGCRWVFKVKYKAGGLVNRHKACLVAKGYSQEAGLDYEELPPCSKIYVYPHSFGDCKPFGLGATSNGCTDSLFKRRAGGRNLYGST